MRVSGLSMDRRSLLLFVLLSASPLPRSAVGIHTSLSLSALAQPDPLLTLRGGLELRNTVDSSSGSEDSGLWDSGGGRGGGGPKGLDEDGLEFQTQEVTVNRQALMALDEPEVADAVMKARDAKQDITEEELAQMMEEDCNLDDFDPTDLTQQGAIVPEKPSRNKKTGTATRATRGGRQKMERKYASGAMPPEQVHELVTAGKGECIEEDAGAGCRVYELVTSGKGEYIEEDAEAGWVTPRRAKVFGDILVLIESHRRSCQLEDCTDICQTPLDEWVELLGQLTDEECLLDGQTGGR
ncbi:hypothetical protein T484DRAFT_1823047 [Baffinella frigidus]|nr:hypothetical protein T484DRAFT_1823047 [Cryptophyta sp. CCMP2293]